MEIIIELELIPIRFDKSVDYKIDNDKLIVEIDGIKEEFDFTGFEEGIAEEIEVEYLPINPIIDVKKEGNTVFIKACRFYSFDEKELFEEDVENGQD